MPMNNDGGRDFTLVRNPNTGLFDLDFDETGNPKCDDTETHTVLSLIAESQGDWWADTTGRRGSLLHKITLDRGSTAAELEGAALDALETASTRITDVEVAAKRERPGRYSMSVKWRTRDGHIQNVRIPVKG
jgi:phage gp46-like protein